MDAVRLGGVSLLGLLLLACGPVRVAEAPDDALARLAEEGGFFPAEVREDPTLSRPLWVLADRHPDPRVVAAALEALPLHLEAGRLARGEVVQVVLKRLEHPDRLVLARALEAAGVVLDEPEVEARVARHLVEGPDAAWRHAALLALTRGDWAARPARVAAVQAVLADPEVVVLAEALQRLGFAAEEIPEEQVPGLLREAVARLDHPQAGPRARALILALRLAPEDPWLRRAGRALLRDRSGAVRGAAAVALGEAGDASALPVLVDLLDDPTPSSWVVDGWSRLDGAPGVLRQGQSRWGRVDGDALEGVLRYAEGQGRAIADLPPVDEEALLSSLLQRARAARRAASSW